MSMHSDIVSTSHIPAYPHHQSHRYASPNQTQQQWSQPTLQPWSYYGPPPSVPQSLYQSSSSNTLDPYRLPEPIPPWQAETTEAEASKRATKGRDYLRNLGKDLATMTLYDGAMKGVETGLRTRTSSGPEKPLPPPPPQLQHRPNTDPLPPQIPQYNAVAGPSSSPKSFKPSPYLVLPDLHTRRPLSDPSLPSSSRLSPTFKPGTQFPLTPPRRAIPKSHTAIDLTYSPASSSSTATPPSNVTPRSPARLRKRATSEQPPTPTALAGQTQSRSPAPKDSGAAVRCAGYTRAGQPCKRLVKASAAFLSTLDLNTAGDQMSSPCLEGSKGTAKVGDEVVGRYCKDHAGMICSASGFYPRDNPGVWVAFDDWIPPELGQQTQTLLRMTMESRLTEKESPGFIYAYELRDLQTVRTSYFKVGRRDNVPRRIGQWTNQCTSKSPTLRDIFPLPPSIHSKSYSSDLSLQRHPTLTRSLLPGAMGSGTITNDNHGRIPSVAMKRWERLIHLELADLASRERPVEWESEDLKGKCSDCGVVHKEVFPVARSQGGGADCYQVVLEIICRWERFVEFAYGKQMG